MDSTIFGESLLLAQFREFYSEVIRLKRMIQAGVWATAPVTVKVEATGAGEEAEGSNGESVNVVWQRLLTILQQQEVNAGRLSGDYMFEFYKEAQYAMAALADEIFLHLEWSGKDVWEDNLLEAKLFNTHSAGDIFFEKVDRLLQTRDMVYTDLAKIYLMAIALGFQGRYRGMEGGEEAIANNRLQLFNFIKQREPEHESESYRIFGQAYSHTLDQGKGKKLPHPRGWVMGLVLLVLGLIGISHLLWINTTADLQSVLHQILNFI